MFKSIVTVEFDDKIIQCKGFKSESAVDCLLETFDHYSPSVDKRCGYTRRINVVDEKGRVHWTSVNSPTTKTGFELIHLEGSYYIGVNNVPMLKGWDVV